jgi:hypothetical protein
MICEMTQIENSAKKNEEARTTWLLLLFNIS